MQTNVAVGGGCLLGNKTEDAVIQTRGKIWINIGTKNIPIDPEVLESMIEDYESWKNSR